MIVASLVLMPRASRGNHLYRSGNGATSKIKVLLGNREACLVVVLDYIVCFLEVSWATNLRKPVAVLAQAILAQAFLLKRPGAPPPPPPARAMCAQVS